MVGHGAKFGHKVEQAIAALLSHRNVEEAARAVGISANTLLRWLKEPEFEAACRETAGGHARCRGDLRAAVVCRGAAPPRDRHPHGLGRTARRHRTDDRAAGVGDGPGGRSGRPGGGLGSGSRASIAALRCDALGRDVARYRSSLCAAGLGARHRDSGGPRRARGAGVRAARRAQLIYSLDLAFAPRGLSICLMKSTLNGRYSLLTPPSLGLPSLRSQFSVDTVSMWSVTRISTGPICLMAILPLSDHAK